MFRLGHKDFGHAAGFLRELYAQTDAAQWPDTLLAGLARLIPCENLGYNDINAGNNQMAIVVVRPFIARAYELAPVLESLFHQHPQLRYYRENNDRGAYQFNDFMSARQFRRTGIYQEFYRHIDADHQLALVLSERGAAADIGIAIHRKHRAFGERDRALLNFLRPHLIQARANALAFTAADRQQQALADSLAAFHAGVVLLRPNGAVAWATPRARELLEQFFPGAARPATQLPEPLERWWWHRQAQGTGGRLEIQTPFIRALGAARLTIHAQTSPDGAHRLLLTGETCFSLAARARQAGLTRREAEVLHWLAEGKTHPEIALILQLSPRTVHKHAEHIFRKLGVETRHAAMLKVLDWRRENRGDPD